MPKKHAAKPPQPKKQTAQDRMIEACVKNARARKRSGETDSEWRKEYAKTLKTEPSAPLSATPFDGTTAKKH